MNHNQNNNKGAPTTGAGFNPINTAYGQLPHHHIPEQYAPSSIHDATNKQIDSLATQACQSFGESVKVLVSGIRQDYERRLEEAYRQIGELQFNHRLASKKFRYTFDLPVDIKLTEEQIVELESLMDDQLEEYLKDKTMTNITADVEEKYSIDFADVSGMVDNSTQLHIIHRAMCSSFTLDECKNTKHEKPTLSIRALINKNILIELPNGSISCNPLLFTFFVITDTIVWDIYEVSKMGYERNPLALYTSENLINMVNMTINLIEEGKSVYLSPGNSIFLRNKPTLIQQ